MENEKKPSSNSQIPSLFRSLREILCCVAEIFSYARGSESEQKSNSSPTPPQQIEDTADRYHDSTFKPLRVIVESTPPPPAPSEQWESREREKHRRDAVRLNIEVAGIVLALAGVIVTGAMWWSTKKAAQAAENAARATESQVRPWIDVDVVGMKIVFDGEGNAAVEVTVKVVNVGHSPATDVNVIPNVVNQFEVGNVDETQRKICEQFEREPEGWGPALFPGKDFIRTYSTSVSKADMAKTGRLFVPNIVGAVCYMTRARGEHHQTNFFYSIIKEKLPNGQLVPIEIKNGRTISSEQIAFVRIYEMGNSAN